MHRFPRWLILALLWGCFSPVAIHGQIDPLPRELIQVGYNGSFQGHPPVALYAFYYRNQPNFFSSNATLRLALAPTYLDAEVGIRQVFGDDTDLGIGIAGGGFADSYDEIRGGTYIPAESFTGHGGEVSASLYHLFNPSSQIPLNGVVRGSIRYSTYESNDDTDTNFSVPSDQPTFSLRTGVRWGGKEPLLFPSLAMELSGWYEGIYRPHPDAYGDVGGNRRLNSWSHLFYGTGLLAYTFPESKHSFFLNLTAGTSIHADRFSAYRLGALLPLVSEFPLSLPGYYFNEITAKHFVLFGGNYLVPLDKNQRWNVNFTATTAVVDYLEGLGQAGKSHTGIGTGILHQSATIKIMLGYGYGVNAIRNSSRGAHTVGLLVQIDITHARQMLLSPEAPGRWRGIQRVLGAFGY